MRKYIFVILILGLSNILSYGQEQCLSDKYLKVFKLNDSQLEQRIKNVIANFPEVKKSDQGYTNNTIIIPVVFNIIHSGEAIGSGKNLSQARIEDQIATLNTAFAGGFGGVNTNITFCLAKKNIVGQMTTGINRFFGDQSSYDIGIGIWPNCTFNTSVDANIKGYNAAGFPNNLFLNIWVTDLKECGNDGLLGYSSFPFVLENPQNEPLDGVVLDYMYVGTNVTSGSLGMCAVHEIGHWLGLFHVFEDEDNVACNTTSCTTEGDMICDTDFVPQSGIDNIAPGNCLGYKCGGQTSTIVQNFMDYQSTARFHCQKSFTSGQRNRMRDMLAFYRGSISTQGSGFTVATCGTYSDNNSPNQDGCSQMPPRRYQPIWPTYTGTGSSYRQAGTVFDVNDKWLVAVDVDSSINIDYPDYIHIYKRQGCMYSLTQSFELPFYGSRYTDYGLLIYDNEIIVSSYRTDTVYIYRYNVTEDRWVIFQHVSDTTYDTNVGTSAFIVGKFLFVAEDDFVNNKFKVYYKNGNGSYVYHQTLAIANFVLPTLKKYIQVANFKTSIVNVNSSTFTGSYDPLEILVAKPLGNWPAFAMFELNSNNIWVNTSTMAPPGMPNTERIHDIEMTKDFIYVLTTAQSGPAGSQDDYLYMYTYRVNYNNSNPFTADLRKQMLMNHENYFYADMDLQVFNDQFFIIDNIKYYPLRVYYNPNPVTSYSHPEWQLRVDRVTCINPGGDRDSFKVLGGLLYYGYKDGIRIFTMSGLMPSQSQEFLDNSDFYNKRVCVTPNDYTTFAKNITVGDCSVNLQNVDKDFIANNSIVLKPGSAVSGNSKVTFRIEDIFGVCDTIVYKTGHQEYEQDDDENLIDRNKENEIIISPNPTTGIATITTTDNVIKSIEVYALNNPSRSIVDKSNWEKNDSIKVDLSNQLPGVYIVKIILFNENIVHKKILKK